MSREVERWVDGRVGYGRKSSVLIGIRCGYSDQF